MKKSPGWWLFDLYNERGSKSSQSMESITVISLAAASGLFMKSIDSVFEKVYNRDTEKKEVAYGTVKNCGAN